MTVSIFSVAGAEDENMPPQNKLVWHKDYSELKAIEENPDTEASEKLSALTLFA